MRLPALVLSALLPCLAFSADWDKDKIQGNPAAPVAIEIYASFDCPHCKILHETFVPQMVRDLVNTGKACIVYKEYPLSPPYHKYAREAANIATAAARIGKYQQVSEALFRTQATWAEAGKIWDAIAPSLNPADVSKIRSLMSEPGVVAEVERDVQEGNASGINQTPTLIVIGRVTGRKYPFIGIPPSYDLFKDFVLKDVK